LAITGHLQGELILKEIWPDDFTIILILYVLRIYNQI
jgi:hypothetical protein